MPEDQDLVRQLAVLDERMKTMQESYEASLARVEAANERRAATQLRWLVGIGLAVGSALVGTIVGGFVILSFMLQN